jgi:hypothetical protein
MRLAWPEHRTYKASSASIARPRCLGSLGGRNSAGVCRVTATEPGATSSASATIADSLTDTDAATMGYSDRPVGEREEP